MADIVVVNKLDCVTSSGNYASRDGVVAGRGDSLGQL